MTESQFRKFTYSPDHGQRWGTEMTAQKNLLIIGAGKFSTEIEELARLNGYTDIAFLDDKPSKWSFSQIN